MNDTKEMEQNFIQNKNVDFSNQQNNDENLNVNKNIVLEEHEAVPKSYMFFLNLKNIIVDASELLSIMNENDEVPAWTQEMLSTAKNNVTKALQYVRSEKTED